MFYDQGRQVNLNNNPHPLPKKKKFLQNKQSLELSALFAAWPDGLVTMALFQEEMSEITSLVKIAVASAAARWWSTALHNMGTPT